MNSSTRRVRRTLAAASAALIIWFAVAGTTPRAAGEARRPPEAAATQPDWQANAERSIAEREYEATNAGVGLQAPNRAQGVRTYFEPSGARIVDREAAGADIAEVRTVSIGRGECVQPVADGEVSSAGARVEVRRPGVVEWYENSERGLEHGYTLSARPGGDGPLAIEIAFGNAAARVENDHATLVSPDGRRLEYAVLTATDANATPLAAHMEAAEDGRVRLVVDDEGAAYPVTVDPMLTSPAFARLDSEQAGAQMGWCVAGAGDVNGDGYADVIVGARFYDAGEADEGAAFVFLGSPTGIASGTPATAAATIQSDQANAVLGYSVAGAGDVNGDGYADVIVGARFYDAGELDEGAAFVFLGSPTGIASGTPGTAAATLQSNQSDARLGSSVAGAGDVNGDGYADVIVGAPLYDAGEMEEGAAFVFLGGPSGIASGTPATASSILQSDQASGQLGFGVAGAGDVNGDGYADVIVGAPFYDTGETDEGAAFVFEGSPFGVLSGNPASASRLHSDQENADLGYSVAGAGDVNGDGYADVIVGAIFYDAGETDEGAAFVFLGSPTGIASGTPATAAATLHSNQVNTDMGLSVAGAGDVNGDGYADVIVGAPSFNAGTVGEGAAFVFLGGPGGIANGDPGTAAATLQSDQVSANLGRSVAGAGDVNGDGRDDVIVGAPGYDDGLEDEGAAFVYQGGPYGLAACPLSASAMQSNQASAQMGSSVASAGDVNGDGYADVIVGAQRYDAGQMDEGAAFVFLGGPSGVTGISPATAATLLQSDQVNGEMGSSVASAGDVNGDGYADVIVGAPTYGAGQEAEGAAFVFLGGPSGVASGTPATAAATFQSDQMNGFLGISVAGAGDVNNDGYSDVIVGALFYSAGQAFEGAAFVFMGGPGGVASGTPATAAATLRADQVNAFLGSSVAGAGDVNNDGYSDVIVGAQAYTSVHTSEGAAFVFLGGSGGIASGTPATAATTLRSDQDDASMGQSVSGAGDVNNDGYADVIVGAPFYDAGQTDEGAAFVFLGSPTGIASATPATADAALQSDQISAKLGFSVAGAGDVNGDGYDDLIVGATNYLSTESSEGSAFVFLGGSGGIVSGTPAAAAVTLQVHQFSAQMGTSVAGAGDVNGDGLADVIVGAPSYDDGQANEGAVFVFEPGACCAGRPSSDSVGVYNQLSGAWFLRETNTPGVAQITFTYGAGGRGFIAIAGDWDGDGIDTPGLYSPMTGTFFLRNSSSPGPADNAFFFGAGGSLYLPIAGDWDGDGVDTVGLYRTATGSFFLKNSNSGGPADLTFVYGVGAAGWKPLAGDWNGDGTTTIGLYDPADGAFFLRNTNTPGNADMVFNFGPLGVSWTPVSGDFNGDGTDTIGLYVPSNGTLFLKNQNTFGPADVTFAFGGPNNAPLIGDWDGQIHRTAKVQ